MLRFGTDGVRGVANRELTPELVLALGRAAARVLGGPRVVVGRDTRRSGPLLEAALTAGLSAEGVDVELLGVVPTPAVAWVAAEAGIPGAVISASHNPFADNGVKLFAAGGHKLTDEVEDTLEAELARILDGSSSVDAPSGPDVGTTVTGTSDLQHWLDTLTGSIDGRRLDGLHVVIDCANGAASRWAPEVLRALGAEVEVIHASPDGTNINDGCGSTHPQGLQRAVRDSAAAAGIAFDGDADRALAVDADGALVDGDHLIAMCAIDRKQRGVLRDDAVVVTVMSNLGFRLGMERHGVHVVEVPVGDRHVLEALTAKGLSLGGEQSGHLIFPDLAATGDGILTAVQVLDLLARSGQPLAELASAAMTRLPQVLRNVAVTDRSVDVGALIASEVAAVEEELGATGRVLIRPSGTEPVVRVMVEAPDESQATAAAERLATRVAALAG
jgi:phosphoglucosamine mutase